MLVAEDNVVDATVKSLGNVTFTTLPTGKPTALVNATVAVPATPAFRLSGATAAPVILISSIVTPGIAVSVSSTFLLLSYVVITKLLVV
ncbi:unnamed protein product [Phytophthora fragariaefolia]|uniref:Unnamed protein product n=1 Tax=Phytophthora fragariaefolia TaxID=1490495 RepID=A0A9W7D2N8_9STRA|nr:unnamed protein product [Phytophthora fragariaefolia]